MSTSSSTTNTLPLLAVLLGWVIISGSVYRRSDRSGDRQFQQETGAARGPVGYLDGAAMLLNDTVSHGETKAGPFLGAFGGEEGVVNPLQMLGRDPGAGIAN